MAYECTRFVGRWTSTILREDSRKGSKGLTQCLWGDWVGVYDLPPERGWRRVRTRGRDGWLHEDDLSAERPLEVNFVDIGQGDGTFVVTPDDKMILIDAGQRSNMYRFLKWRFNLNRNAMAPQIDVAVITHPDSDHYKGFQKLFDDERFKFGTVFHNGIVERTGDDSLGPSTVHGGQRYLTDVVADKAALRALLRKASNRGKKEYPKLLWMAVSQSRVSDIRMLAAGDQAFRPREMFGKQLSMQALAPVPEKVNGHTVLRWFDEEPGNTIKGNVGKHSRGARSLIFSTELARSAPERIIDAKAIQNQVLELADKMAAASGAKRTEARTTLEREVRKTIRRSVEVYGLITLRTDGNRIVMAQRLDKAASLTRKWDLYPIERHNGKLEYQSKHDAH